MLMWVSKTSGGRVIGRELLSSEVNLIYAEKLHWDLLKAEITLIHTPSEGSDGSGFLASQSERILQVL